MRSSPNANLGPVHGRAAHADPPCNLLVAGPGMRGQQNMRSFELARRVLAAAEQRPQCGALDLAEVDPIAYIHGVPPCSRRASTTESDGRRKSFDKNLHAQAGAVSGLYPPIYEVAPQTPAEIDIHEYFRVSPPSVHQMVLTLERASLITRQPRTPRSIKVLVNSKLLPELI